MYFLSFVSFINDVAGLQIISGLRAVSGCVTVHSLISDFACGAVKYTEAIELAQAQRAEKT